MTSLQTPQASEFSFGQPYLTFLVRGQGRSEDGFVFDSATGFALWFEGASKCVKLRGPKQAQIVVSMGAPFLDIYDMTRRECEGFVPTRELRLPCVDVIGLAVLDDELESYRDDLAHERTLRSLH